MAADSETIFALASGAGRAAIGVVRVSGVDTARIINNLSGALPPPRRVSVRALRSQAGLIDRALVLWLPGPGSYSGEDSAEFHIHGGRAVLQALSSALLALGARPAEPGEFTRRAFINNRMGLLEAEAVADLVDAETQAQRRQALRQMDGAQSSKITAWADQLRRLLAWQEALIDFPEEDLPPDVEASLAAELSQLLTDIEQGVTESSRGIRLREGLVVAVTGAPNVGKSSLVNALAGRDVAIVSPSPGTTRDALEVTIDLGGVMVTLIDTAGLRETDDPVEAEGVRRALARAASADLVLEVYDASTIPDGILNDNPNRIAVANKMDLFSVHGMPGLSALTGAGIDALRISLTEQAGRLANMGGHPVFTRARHAAALRDAAAALAAASASTLPELRGEELRLALAALGRVTGAVDVDMVLDLVFSQFCIGK
jgi:tRNA modification GTPase